MQSVPAVREILTDRYYIKEILDTGGCTATMKCFDTRLDVSGAIKMLVGDDEQPDWENKKERFIKAFRSQARLNHPNIVHIADIEMRRGQMFAVMELLDGRSLDLYLRETELSSKAVIELFLGIVDAVGLAHSQEIIHGGIWPRNILMSLQGKRVSPRIINFAVPHDPRELDPQEQLPFVAPELLDPAVKSSAASDVYGICASIYYAFVHRPPVNLNSYTAYVNYFAFETDLASFPELIPENFIPLLQKGLRVRAEERYQNANELLTDLKQLSQGLTLSANLSLDGRHSQPDLQVMSSSRPGDSVLPGSSSMTPSRPVAIVHGTGSHVARNQTGSNPQLSSMTPSRPVPIVSGTGSHVVRHQTGSVPQLDVSSASKQVLMINSGTGSFQQPGTDSNASSAGASSASSPQIASIPVSSSVSQSILVPEAFRENQTKVPDNAPKSVDAVAVQVPMEPELPANRMELLEPPPSYVASALDNIQLPDELARIYQIRRIDCVSERSMIVAVSTYEAPNDLYSIKVFWPKEEVEADVFNEGVRRAELLSRDNPYFESIYERYPDSCAIMMPDTMRTPLPMYVESNGAMALGTVLHISILIAQAMVMAQQAGFVNGNIKPENIIFEDHNGVFTPVIYDFGQRLYIHSIDQLGLNELPYVAPELGYNLQNSNSQSDIYAFGMCMVYMIMGELPFVSENAEDLVKEIAGLSELPDIREFRSDVSADLLQVIRWCTAPDPAQRYVRFEDVVRDLYVIYQQMNGTV